MLNTSVSVNFDSRGKRLILETDDTVTLEKDPGESYVRVFPHSAEPVVSAVMGKVSKVGQNIPLEVEDYVSFSGTSSASLQYPPVGEVEILDRKFWRSNPVVVYDEDEVALVLDQQAHGIVKVRYTAFYDRHKVTHSGDQCRITTEDEELDASYDPAFLVAEADDYEPVSLELSGPPCKGQSDIISVATAAYSKYNALGLVVEEDLRCGLWPYYFTAGRHPNGFSVQPQYVTVGGQTVKWFCGARVRVYGAENSVQAIPVNCSVSSAATGRGTLEVLQSLTFSGSQSVNLDYPPNSGVDLSLFGNDALTVFNTIKSVRLAGPNELITEVEWKNANTYSYVGSRRVREDEVVAVTSSGTKTLPCYTFGQASYDSDYMVFDVLLNFNSDIEWYTPCMVLFVAGNGKSGSIQLTPPSLGGAL